MIIRTKIVCYFLFIARSNLLYIEKTSGKIHRKNYPMDDIQKGKITYKMSMEITYTHKTKERKEKKNKRKNPSYTSNSKGK
jgi:hypothetical protein